MYRVTETADFRAESGGPSDQRRIAADAAIKLDTAKKLFRKKVICCAVIGEPKSDSAVPSIKLLNKYVDEIYNIESTADMATYWQKMLEAAHESMALSH